MNSFLATEQKSTRGTTGEAVHCVTQALCSLVSGLLIDVLVQCIFKVFGEGVTCIHVEYIFEKYLYNSYPLIEKRFSRIFRVFSSLSHAIFVRHSLSVA